jgi:hypothetical protein
MSFAKGIADLVGHELNLVAPDSWGAQLLLGAELGASLTYGWDQALGECLEGAWHYETGREGTHYASVVIRDFPKGAQVGKFVGNLHYLGGTIHATGGDEYKVSMEGFWRRRITLRKGRLKLLVINQNGFALLRPRSRVFIHSDASSIPDLQWLVILACYLVYAPPRWQEIPDSRAFWVVALTALVAVGGPLAFAPPSFDVRPFTPVLPR